jgi:hypothetical protein
MNELKEMNKYGVSLATCFAPVWESADFEITQVSKSVDSEKIIKRENSVKHILMQHRLSNRTTFDHKKKT